MTRKFSEAAGLIQLLQLGREKNLVTLAPVSPHSSAALIALNMGGWRRSLTRRHVVFSVSGGYGFVDYEPGGFD
jgi:hypothetical protein